MSKKLLPLYHVSQIRAKEEVAYREGLTPKALMERAAGAVFRELNTHWGETQSWLVICGAGNNGGDGWVVAQLALQAGRAVHVMTAVAPEALTDLAAEVAQEACHAGVPWSLWGDWPERYDLVVDAMIGIGLTGAPKGAHLEMIARINAGDQPVVAIDCPSGLMADTGQMLGGAVQANMTVTLLGRKAGLYTGFGPSLSGEIVCDDLAVDHDDPPCAFYQDIMEPVLPARSPNSHKGSYGHVWVVGGGRGMGGAAVLAASAAMQAGAGKVTVSMDAIYESAVVTACPAAMTFSMDRYLAAPSLPAGVNVVAVGPGLGRDDAAAKVWQSILSYDAQYVLDADALYHLQHSSQPLPSSLVITPHPGEAARLLKTDTETVQANRWEAAQTLSDQYKAVCILKGAGTIVARPDAEPPYVCSGDHPALAKAGFGDVLTGMVAALLAQGLSPWEAAITAVALHARTATRLALMVGEHAVGPVRMIEMIR